MGGQTWVPQFLMDGESSKWIKIYGPRSLIVDPPSLPLELSVNHLIRPKLTYKICMATGACRDDPSSAHGLCKKLWKATQNGNELQENPTLSGKRWWEKQNQELLESSMKTRYWLANWPWKTQAIYKAFVPLPTGCPCDRCHHFRPAPVPLCLGFGNAQHHALRRSETQAPWAPPWAWRLLRACLGRISPWDEDIIKQMWPSPWPQEFIDPIFKRGF